MRQVLVPALAFVLGITVALAIYKTVFEKTVFEKPVMERAAGARQNAPPSAAAPAPAAEPLNAAGLRAKAWELFRSGHAREAQDDLLQVLATRPGDPEALRGLVAVRKLMAAGNPEKLRRQVAEFDDAIKRGVETDEHYTVEAMKILRGAAKQALQEVDAQAVRGSASGRTPLHRGQQPAAPPAELETPPVGKGAATAAAPKIPVPQAPAPSPAAVPVPPAPSAKTITRQPSTTASKDPEKRSTTSTVRAVVPQQAPRSPSSQKGPSTIRTPAPTAAAPSAPAASGTQKTFNVPAPAGPATAPATGPPSTGPSTGLYVVRAGSITDRERASSLVRQLAARGFPSTAVTNQVQYRVVSEPLPRSVAQTLASRLGGRGIQSTVESLSGDTVQLFFGSFGSQKDAEALSQRISVQGYDSWVREAGTYGVRIGPYLNTALKAITDIIKSTTPDAAVSIDPVASQPPPAAGAAAVPSPPTPVTAAPRTPSSPTAPTSAPRPAPPATPAAAGPPARTPAVTTPQPAPSPSGVPAPSNGYMVRVGPVTDRERASAIARQLVAGGFASASVASHTAFRVVSEPLPRSAADQVVSLLDGRGIHAQIEPINADTVEVLFGSFSTQKEAEALSKRIGEQGYDAWLREGTVFMVQVGPYPQSAVTAITGIVKSNAPDTAVTADPVP